MTTSESNRVAKAWAVAYALFAIAWVAYQALGTAFAHYPGGRDFWEHFAAIAEVARNPLNPGNPYLALDQPTHLLTPYHWVWGILFALTRIDPFTGMALIAAVNTIFWCVALRRLSGRILGNVDLALPLALLLLFGWWYPLRWSGFYHLGMQPIAAVYPATFAFAATLWLMADFDSTASRGRLALRVLFMSLIFISHPLTGTFLFLASGIQALCAEKTTWPRRLSLASLPAASVLLALAWPLFPVLPSILGSARFEAVGFAGDPALFYTRPLEQIAPALIGCAWGAVMLVRSPRHPLPWLTLATAVLFAVNFFYPRNALFARYLIFLACCGQALVAMGLGALPAGRVRMAGTMAALLLALWFGKHMAKWSLESLAPYQQKIQPSKDQPNSNRSLAKNLRAALAPTQPGDVVLAPLDESWYLAGLTGCKVVGVHHSNPFFTDYFRRLQAIAPLFDPRPMSMTAADPEIWRYVVSKYSVRWILLPRSAASPPAELPLEAVAIPGTSEYALWRVAISTAP
jgi:hypothetical protein